MKIVIAVGLTMVAIVSLAIAQNLQVHKIRYWPSDPVSDVYVLPADAELIVGPIVSTFSCIGRIYGYYADVDNNCQIFHVCLPHWDEQGNEVPFVYSFFCGNQTVYDQSLLVCVHPQEAIPCDESGTWYKKNEEFGKTDYPRPPTPPTPTPTPRTPRPPTPPTPDPRYKVIEIGPDGKERFVKNITDPSTVWSPPQLP